MTTSSPPPAATASSSTGRDGRGRNLGFAQPAIFVQVGKFRWCRLSGAHRDVEVKSP